MHWAENKAGKGKAPELSPFQTLIEPGNSVAYGEPLSEDDLKGPTSATRVWADDVNGDGKLDLLVGDNVTLISPAKGVSAEEFKKKFAEWQEAVKSASAALSSAGNDEKAQEKAQQELVKVYNRRSEFMTEDRTGFVWLYLQK